MFMGGMLQRNTCAGIVLLAFFFCLVIGTLVSEFFRTPESMETELAKYKQLFSRKLFSDVDSFSLTNRFGTFKFIKRAEEGESFWFMDFPRKLPADGRTVENIWASLAKIRIKNIYSYDAINMANYSLESPLIEIVAQNFRGGTNTIKFGLVNPIDNSTYVSTSQGEAIYHVDAFAHSLDSLGITDFVDAKVFTLVSENIGELKIYRGTQKNIPFLHIKKRDGRWVDRKGRRLNGQKVVAYLNELTAMKSSLILDETSEELRARVDALFSHPLYVLEIEDIEGRRYDYRITSVIGQLPDINIERRKNFIMKASNRSFPYVLNREYLKYFFWTENRLRGPRKALGQVSSE